ncbi:MAG: hypothetical protein KGJ42_06395, partial [Acidobacteriota bacterium]|nr:hypothetical protein [Acidobacteriota bacterium]
MNASRNMKAVRVATSSLVGLTLTVGGTSVAFAHDANHHGQKGHDGLHASGTISAISATTPESLTVTLKNGTSVTYATTAATTYFEGRTAASA